MSFNEIQIVSIKGGTSRIQFSGMSKDKSIYMIKKSIDINC